MAEGPGSISSIVDSVFTEFLSKKLEKDDSDPKDKKQKHKSHKDKHKKHKHKDKTKEKEEKEGKSKKHKDKRSKSKSRERDLSLERKSSSKELKDSRSQRNDSDSLYNDSDKYRSRKEYSKCKDSFYSNHESDKKRSSSVEKSLSVHRPRSRSPTDRLQASDDSGDSPVVEDTSFFAKEGFLDPKSKKDKKHKKHKKDQKHKHKHKDKDKHKSKNEGKLSFTGVVDDDGEDSPNSKGTGSGIDTPKNEKANEFERELREKLINMKDNLTKKHKALEDIAKAPPSPSKKIKLCTEISLVEKYGDKENGDSSESNAVSDSVKNESSLPEEKEDTVAEETRNVQESGGKLKIELSTISLPPGEPPNKTSSKEEVDEDGFKMMLPRSVKLSAEETKDKEETEVAKPVPQPVPPPAKKMMSLKISASSASLISSGVKVEDPKKPSMEEGELSDSPDSGKSSGTDVSSGSLSALSSELEDEDTDGEIKEKKTKKKREKKKKKKDKKSKKSRSKSPKRSRRHSRSRSRSFDEERGVWKDDSRSRRRKSRSRSKERNRRSRDKERDRYKSHSRDRGRSRDRDRRRSRSPHSYRDRDRGRGYYGRSRDRPFYARDYRGRSRSRSRSRERDRRRSKTPEDLRLKIDRVKLREIAMRNAYAAVHEGRSLQTLQPDQIAALKAGGKSLEELTEFCKKITEKEALKSAGHISDSEEQEAAPDDESMFINHPFAVREPTNMEITMRIRNAKQLPVSSFAERQQQAAELRLQFPVSSGTVHKDKEDEWVPVEKPEPAPAPPPAKPAEKAKESKDDKAAEAAKKDAMLMPPPPPPGKPPDTSTAPVLEPIVFPAKPEEKVFPDRPENLKGPINIGDVVSERLSAIRKLQDNPNDVEAMGNMYKAQKAMDNWALSKQLPGAWMGGTGIQKGSGTDLHKSGFQAWAKKDQFNAAAPLKGGIGMALLQKMGWREGEGLGKLGMGELEPLQLDVKIDRRGLVSEGECLPNQAKGKAKGGSNNPPIRDLSGKHPVSALMEMAKRRRWAPPVFELAFEHGPPHKKNFLFKVKVDDTWYQPSIASGNKKHAKCQAATVALQSFGLLPKDGTV